MVRGQPHASAALYPGKAPVPILQEAGWAPGLVWTGAENLAPTGIRSPAVQPVDSRSADYATRPERRRRGLFYVLCQRIFRETGLFSPFSGTIMKRLVCFLAFNR